MEVNRENVDKAFALAHRASEDGRHSPAARAVFRAVAHQIWLACGESRPTAAVIQARADTDLSWLPEGGNGIDRKLFPK